MKDTQNKQFVLINRSLDFSDLEIEVCKKIETYSRKIDR